MSGLISESRERPASAGEGLNLLNEKLNLVTQKVDAGFERVESNFERVDRDIRELLAVIFRFGGRIMIAIVALIGVIAPCLRQASLRASGHRRSRAGPHALNRTVTAAK